MTTENNNTNTLGLFDVLCGRDKDAYHNVGNRRFRVMINLNLSRYTACQSRYEKGTLISSLTEELTDVTSPCAARFLKRVRDDETGNATLLELDLEQSREKVAHSLRDAVTQQNKRNKKRKEEKGNENKKKKKQKTDSEDGSSSTTTAITKPPGIKIRATTESTVESAKALTHLMTPASAEALVDLITPIIRDYSDANANANANAPPKLIGYASAPIPSSAPVAVAVQPAARRNTMFLLGQDEELTGELEQLLPQISDSFKFNRNHNHDDDDNHNNYGYGYNDNDHDLDNINNDNAPIPVPARRSRRHSSSSSSSSSIRSSDPVLVPVLPCRRHPNRRHSSIISHTHSSMSSIYSEENMALTQVEEEEHSLTHDVCETFNHNHNHDDNHDDNHNHNHDHNHDHNHNHDDSHGHDHNGHDNNNNDTNGKQQHIHNHTIDTNHDAAALAPNSRQQHQPQQQKRGSMFVFQDFAETEEEQHSRKTCLADCFDDDDYCQDQHMHDTDDDDDEEEGAADQLTFFSSGLEELERLSSVKNMKYML